jgi:hypothetical protein
LVPLLGLASACLDRPIGSPPPVTTNIFVDRITQTSVDKIDLLFMIDNSSSMADKQAILQAAVPDLVNRLVNPICVDSLGGQFDPPPQGGSCPAGQSQEFNPIRDINIGVVSSSLGDVGADDACPTDTTKRGYLLDRIDMAHLMGSLTRGRAAGANDSGFLEWRAGTTNLDTFSNNFQRMVSDVGENGCGWEASLESWYRFLVDPVPYRQLIRVQCAGTNQVGLNCVQPATDVDGNVLRDDVLLAQRAAFLRPDSLVAIIMLSDENDCSLQVGNQTWVVASITGDFPMFRGSSACDADPNAKCCYSCPLRPPEGCEVDPVCAANPAEMTQANRLPNVDDGRNLRCFQQKRRFGVDFLYPTQRYVNALKQLNICWNALDLSLEGCAPENVRLNPLYAGGREQSLVFLGGIVGVPWQAIQSTVDANDDPITDPTVLRFQDADELNQNNTWNVILGDVGVPYRAPGAAGPEVQGRPAVPPSMPQMVESEFPRNGVANPNLINGREYDTSIGNMVAGQPNDLEYACIFPLPENIDCTDPARRDACDCLLNATDRPLCEEDPGLTAAGTTQFWSKAYPGTRHLEVLKEYGDNSIVASICARNVDNLEASDYGYRPAIAAIVDRLKEQLGDRCLPRGLTVAEDDTVACNLVETTPQLAPGEACNCDPRVARVPPNEVVDSVVRGQLANDVVSRCAADDPNCTRACLCEVQQVQDVDSNPDDALEVCRQNELASGVEGWCYVDDEQNIGNPALVADCPATARRKLRFVGGGLAPNTTTFVFCQGSSLAAREE